MLQPFHTVICCIYYYILVNIEDDTRLFNLSASIEEHIFSEFKDTNMKYKNRVRSRVSNIGDVKNPGLKQKLIAGDISPSRMATMSTEV